MTSSVRTVCLGSSTGSYVYMYRRCKDEGKGVEVEVDRLVELSR